MEPTLQSRSHAKDVFLNLASMIALYATAGALLNLLFTIINKAYPKVTPYYSYYSSSSISFPVATLIIVFPLYILFMWLIEKDIAGSMEARMSGIRKWLVYITLFISGALVVGDLVAVVYYFIDGQDITTGFLLKVLSVLAVAGGVFGYYITDIRNKLTGGKRKTATLCASILIVASVVVGFAVIGSPRTQRLVKYDELKISNLQSLVSEVRYYYERNNILPATLAELAQNAVYGGMYTDSQSNKPYVYEVVNDKTFKVCAEFNLDSSRDSVAQIHPELDVWNTYKAGQYCFTQSVSPSPKLP